jgi:hypothetical protein
MAEASDAGLLSILLDILFGLFILNFYCSLTRRFLKIFLLFDLYDAPQGSSFPPPPLLAGATLVIFSPGKCVFC